MKPAILPVLFFTMLVASGCTDKFPPSPGPSDTLSMAGIVWELVSIQHSNVTAPIDSGITLVFGASTLRGDGPCNAYNGQYTAGASTISISKLSWTERYCGRMDLESEYFGYLGRSESYMLGPTQLRMFADGGATVLTYRKTSRDVGTVPRDSIPTTNAPIDSTNWLLVSIEERGIVKHMDSAGRNTLAFTGESGMSGSLNCAGTYGGFYVRHADSLTIVIRWVPASGFCEDIKNQYLVPLQRVVRYHCDGSSLVLTTDNGVVLRYARLAEVPQVAWLSGPAWQLVRVRNFNAGTVKEYPRGGTAWIRFSRPDLQGFGFCNAYNGFYTSSETPNEGTLTLSNLSSGQIRCGTIENEIDYLAVLGAVTGYRVTDSTLVLSSRIGEIGYVTR